MSRKVASKGSISNPLLARVNIYRAGARATFNTATPVEFAIAPLAD